MLRLPDRRGLLALLPGLAVAFQLVACPGGVPGDGDGDGDGDADAVGDGDGDPGDGDGDGDGDGWPPADTDTTARLGSDETLDIATWNIETFPKTSGTPAFVADLIRSMDLDLIAVEEISDVDAFEELLGRLPEHDGVLSPHTYGDGSYQKVGFIYRTGLITLLDVTTIYNGNWFAFPRPPLQARVVVDDGVGDPFEFTAIAVHLKASNDDESIQRRVEAIQVLDSYVRSLETDVFVLGDFNEVLDNPFGREVFAPFADADDDYTIYTEQPALAGYASYVPSGRLIDHVVATASLDDEVASGDVIIPNLDNQFLTYVGSTSDHLPVVLTFPMP